MLQFDNLKNPVPTINKRTNMSQAQQLAFLEQHPYGSYRKEDLEVAKGMLKKEMDYVKNGMSHGELPLEVYTQVCYYYYNVLQEAIFIYLFKRAYTLLQNIYI